MKTILMPFILFTFLLLESCVQNSSQLRKSNITAKSTANPNSETTGSATYPGFSADEMSYWFTTLKIIGTITINKNSQEVTYLRGKDIHDFLNAKDSVGTENFRKQYCLIGNFSSTAYKQIRVRAIPIYALTSLKAIERLFRIDIPSLADNTSACGNTTIDTTTPALAAYSLPDICPACTTQVTTSNLNLYLANSGALTPVLSSSLDLASMLIKIDLSSNSTTPNSTCSTSFCTAKGFDCCISGQCVKDASEKLNAKSDSQYYQALADYTKNPLTFINYPNIFNICSNIFHVPPPVITTPSSPSTDAALRVTKYLADYTCLTDVSAGNGYTTCRNLNSTGIATTIDKSEAAYTAIKKKLAVACGCTAIDAQMAVKCPDWGVLPVYPAMSLKINSNITDFTCYTPAPINQIGPIINLNVSVSNRSAPHRFFSTAAINYDDLTGLKTQNPTLLQEGDDFFYSDEYNKIGPVNGAFNINSILGRMSIDLTHTLPAKMVAVEIGKTYILSATSGYFTPCTQCVKDSWFQSFYAFPASRFGIGLQASGHTTSRDTFSSNATFGNYEDTKFGRACYLPVTMLPFAHQKYSTLQVQRQTRLKTQAAYYINGYQRDWNGFNYGALIASFDGVDWFAVGAGRRITATSSKLFLALNAAYLDLADKTDTVVNIIPDFSANSAANFDFDPDLALQDPKQNKGATCQKYHQCSNDADCVTQLGWEYTCADVSQYKTKWPQFDGDGNELANQERSATLFEILQNTISTTSGKRCIYRGAGAPCRLNYNSFTNELNKKIFACAPNFYCASFALSKFNDQVARSPNELDNFLFGMDANILGRPLNYVTANKHLPADIISNIEYNATGALGLSALEAKSMGMCRPGKLLNSVVSDETNQSSPDTSKRTDYISQISSCNSSTTGTDRLITCPAFDSDLNYISSSLEEKTVQNSCGAESQSIAGVSAFKFIEALALNVQNSISAPMLAKDACFRRAGSICHSDLDCSPNKMHEEAVSSTSTSFFGGTEAEQSYWKESLICGQVTPVPNFGNSSYYDYKLSSNRCCREVGKDFTMYTESTSTKLVPENSGTNINLSTSTLAYSDPKVLNRYSRYTISKTAKNNLATYPKVVSATPPATNQWKVINETGALTCCGGGWIRKFSDGSHDWSIRNRFSIDPSNFNCLNFRSPLADSSYSPLVTVADNVDPVSYQREFELFCKSPDGTGCFQIPFQKSENYTILSPKSYTPTSILDTSPSADPIDGTVPWTQTLNTDVPYMPSPFYYSPIPYDVDPKTNKAYNFFTGRDFDYGVEFYLPTYIPEANITSVSIQYFYDAPVLPVTVAIPAVGAGECANVIESPTIMPINQIASVDEGYCVHKSATTQNRPVFIAKARPATAAVPGTWKYAGVIIHFDTVESRRAGLVASTPGNAMYYLTKLARLELIGIPQITYEPIYCSNDNSKIVPGIFQSGLTNRALFTAATNGSAYAENTVTTYNADSSANSLEQLGYGNYNLRFVFQDQLDHSAVFSSKDFTCCTPLGKISSGSAACCSGYSVKASDGKTSICKLPRGTDLHVYFNKFVSGEGIGADQPGGGLIADGVIGTEDDDFNSYTGEPKLRGTTYDKLVALGGNYCDGGKLGTGGAFGAYPPEPFSGSYTVPSGSTGNIEDLFPMSIVDSITDFVTKDPDLGKVQFDSGYRWNHHFYCK